MPYIPPMKRFDRFLIKMCLTSMADCPRQWHLDSYTAKNNKLGISISGITGKNALTIKTDEGYEYGGVSFWSVFFGWFGWRGALHRALMGMQIKRFMVRQNLQYND